MCLHLCDSFILQLKICTSQSPPPISLIPPPPSGNHLFVLSLSLFLFAVVVHLFCFLDSTCKWNHMVFVFQFMNIYIYVCILATSVTYWSFWARDWIWATAVTYTAAVAMLDPLTHFARLGIEPVPQQQPQLLQIQGRTLNLLCHSGNAKLWIFFNDSTCIN